MRQQKSLKKFTPSDFLSTHCEASASTTTAVSQNIHIHKLISVLILFSYVYGKKIRIQWDDSSILKLTQDIVSSIILEPGITPQTAESPMFK